MTKSVGIYIRVSTQEQALEGYSIEAQTDRLTNYCKAKNWSIYNIYTDGGFSGSNIKRPVMQNLIADIKNNNIDCVLVYKLDRLSRSQKDTLFLIEDLFLKNNVEFVSMNENFDTSTPFGRATIGILSVFAQLEREQIKERSLMGRAERAKNGYFHGGGYSPIGYDYIDGELVINEFQAMQVREVYRLYLNNVSIYRIWDTLYHKYHTFASESSIRSILTSPIYKGIITWHGQEYQGRHQAIIDEETFNKASEKYSSSKWQVFKGQIHRPYQTTTLLSSLLVCENCGARYFAKGNYSGHGRKKRYYPYYYCYSRAKTNKKFIIDADCKNPVYAVEKLDKLIIGEIKKLSTDDKYIYAAQDESNYKQTKLDETAILKKQIKDIDAQISRLLDLYQLGTLPINNIKLRLDNLQTEKEQIQHSLDELTVEDTKLNITEVKNLLANIDNVFETGSLSEKRHVIHSLINEITVLKEPNNFKIHWNF